MAVFKWTAETRKGRIVKGEVEALDEKAARLQLRRRSLTVKRIRPKPKDLFENVSFLQPKVTLKDVLIFTRQFSTMIDAGLPLVQGLSIIAAQSENRTFRRILKQVTRDVAGGATLAEAMGKHPAVFNDLFVNMVAAGEAGGILDTILQRLGAHMEKADKLRSRIKRAFTYPILVVGVAIMVVGIILVFVIPVFQELFSGMGAALPGPTLVVIALSNFFKKNIPYLAGVAVLAFWVFRLYRKSRAGRKSTDALALKLPLFGALLKKVAVARFTRTLGTMLTSGVPILEALDIVARTAGNVVIEEVIYEVRGSIAEGQAIAEPLAETPIFPGMVVQMIAVGEASGALDAMLEKIADFYEEEVDAEVETLTTMLEPLLMVFLGGTIGGLVLAMYLPIFKMAGTIGG